MTRILVIGSSGTVGSQLIKQLHHLPDDITVRHSTSRPDVAAQWREEGRDAVILDLNKPETFAHALDGIDRVFLLTGYTAEMLYQSKMFVDAATKAEIEHIVHLGVFTSGRDHIPHFAWHDLIENYIKASGIAWTNLHPNVILDSLLVTQPPITETGSFQVMWGEAAMGWVCSADIAAVAATVLREGPRKHASMDYYLSPEILTGPEAATILSEALETKIVCKVANSDTLSAYVSHVPNAGARLYMESAVQTMRQGENGHMRFQATVRDDVKTVLGRAATPLREWASQNLSSA